MIHRVETEVGGKKMIFEVGRVARQASSAVWVQYGDAVVLVAVVASNKVGPWPDQIALTVDYQEKAYSGGKIPGGFFKREGRPSEKETLGCRMIDRALRPLFPKNWFYETQITAFVLSSDQGMAAETMAIAGASLALTLSDIPFDGPVGAVRVGRCGGRFVINPTAEQFETSDLNIMVAGVDQAITMLECESKEMPEDTLMEAIAAGHHALGSLIACQRELQKEIGQTKREGVPPPQNAPWVESACALWRERMKTALRTPGGKADRKARVDALLSEAIEAAKQESPSVDQTGAITTILHKIEAEETRRMILDEKVRADGRSLTQIRPITCMVGVLPRAHGSAIFTRGETQSLAVATLGTTDDEQRVETLEGEIRKSFTLHYNFPSFSVGEARSLRGPGRREIGHGALAERALKQVLPSKESFAYTVRLVSDILESNGSSSMASVCGGTLALMDAGVPITRPVAGVAMGLVTAGDRAEVLSDISGSEDAYGDMDFKVAGTTVGVTAIQLDIKVKGMTLDLLKRALIQARVERLSILEQMLSTLPAPRTELSMHAPRIVTIKIRQEKIGAVIGPGGKIVKGIIEKTGVKINIQDDGNIDIGSTNAEAVKNAIAMIKEITEEVEVGRTYLGKVVRIVDFGAFVELRRGVDGLVHISQLSHERVERVSDVVREGDEIEVKVIEVDKQGKIRLSRKELLGEPTSKRKGPGHS